MNANSNTLAVQNLRSSYGEGKAGRDAGAANIRSDADQSYISGTPLVGQLGGSPLAALQGRNQRLATNEVLGAQIADITESRIGNQSSFTRSNNQTAERYAQESAKVNRDAGDRMGAISIQQGKESAGVAYAGAAGTAIAGHWTARGLNDQVTKVEFTGRVAAATITHQPQLTLPNCKQCPQSLVVWERSWPRISRRAWKCATEFPHCNPSKLFKQSLFTSRGNLWYSTF